MDDRRIQQHEQAVTYWRTVERQGRDDQAEAHGQIRTERQEENVERDTKHQGRRL
jgi:hypothetical protein